MILWVLGFVVRIVSPKIPTGNSLKLMTILALPDVATVIVLLPKFFKEEVKNAQEQVAGDSVSPSWSVPTLQYWSIASLTRSNAVSPVGVPLGTGASVQVGGSAQMIKILGEEAHPALLGSKPISLSVNIGWLRS